MKCSQNRAILAYLKKGKKLTPIDALNMFSCFRLGARVYDLKEQGYDIRSTMVWRGAKRVAQYALGSKPRKIPAIVEW